MKETTQKEAIAVLKIQVEHIEKTLSSVDRKLDAAIQSKADKTDVEAFKKLSDKQDALHAAQIVELQLNNTKYSTIVGIIAGAVPTIVTILLFILGR